MCYAAGFRRKGVLGSASDDLQLIPGSAIASFIPMIVALVRVHQHVRSVTQASLHAGLCVELSVTILLQCVYLDATITGD